MAYQDIKLVIPPDLDEKYNHAFFQQKIGDNTLIGYEEQREKLDRVMHRYKLTSAMLVGPQGIGKTALIEQFVYDRAQTDNPALVVGLSLEELGALPENVLISRLRTLLNDMKLIEKATKDANPNEQFQMILFIDEIHKLALYGETEVGSKAMNALKEDTSRGVFPVFGATTDYEFKKFLAPDPAFTRRFSPIILSEPPKEVVLTILNRLLNTYRKQGKFVPLVLPKQLSELVDYANAYVHDQANPAKAIGVLDDALSYCLKAHLKDPMQGVKLSHEVIREVFLGQGIDVDDVKPNEIKLVMTPALHEKYNNALSQLKNGNNTLIGYQEQLEELDSAICSPENPGALLLGAQGIGKTALIEQWAYNRSLTSRPVAVVSLTLETLGELGSEKMVSRLRTLLSDLNDVKKTTQEANPNKKFDMVLFIDEIHKLRNYGAQPSGGIGSSGAMNALKEELGRGRFPVIGATTDYEYLEYIVPDLAFDRRFGKVIMQAPNQKTTVDILRRRVEYHQTNDKFYPSVDDKILKQIVVFADAFIANRVNPEKSLAILDKASGLCIHEHLEDANKGLEITRNEVTKAFMAEGYEIDPSTGAEDIIASVSKRVLGQPLAINQLADVIRSAHYVKRNYKRPLITAFFVGTTGVGKSETAKALAQAYYGNSDSILVINGGDYVTKDSAIQAQYTVGDAMAVNKRQLILLDEIEKAHITVMDSFMRMIDDGIVRDRHGIERSINSTIVIATSNLGATIFSELANNMHLHRQSNPNVLTPGLDEAWYRKDAEVRKALQAGDVGLNNGIKPEFLERFSLFVPFLPLARKTIANIARLQLEKFRDDMQEALYPITISLPKKESNIFWQHQMSSPQTPYGDNDKLSVMIAEDIVGSEAQTSGARSISRFINGQVKTQVVKLLDQRVRKHLPIDGQFRLEAMNPSFETNDGKRKGVKVTYIDRKDLI